MCTLPFSSSSEVEVKESPRRTGLSINGLFFFLFSPLILVPVVFLSQCVSPDIAGGTHEQKGKKHRRATISHLPHERVGEKSRTVDRVSFLLT